MKQRIKLSLLVLFLIVCSIGSNAQVSNYNFIKNNDVLFDENMQAVQEVLFLGVQPNLNIQLRAGGFSYDTYADEMTSPELNEKGDFEVNLKERKFHRVDFNFVNANANVQFDYNNQNTTLYKVEGAERSLFEISNKVTAKNVYDNIDVEYVFENKQFKYNIVLNPGADINDLSINVSESENVSLVDNELKIQTTNGVLTENIPVSFYSDNGQKVNVNYRFENGQISFQTDEKIQSDRNFVIDPAGVLALQWGTYSGGLEDDEYNNSTVDDQGFIYMVGYTFNTTMMTTVGAHQATYGAGGSESALIQKFDQDGNLIWGSYYGGAGASASNFNDITFSNGFLYACGNAFNGFTHTGNIFQNTINGSADGILMKLNTDGIPEWSTYYGGTGFDACESVVANATDVYISAVVGNSTISVSTSGAYDETENGIFDVNLARFDVAGNRIWSTYYGGTDRDNPYGLSLINNELVINGVTESTDLPMSPGVYQNTLGGDRDIFLAVFDLNGQFSRASYIGGLDDDWCTSKRVAEESGDYIFTGKLASNVVNTPGLNQFIAPANEEQPFVARITSDLVNLSATYVGTGVGQTANQNGKGVDVADDGTIWAVGYTSYQTGIATPDGYRTTLPLTTSFNQDGYLIQLSSDLSTLLYGTYIGRTSVNPSNSNGTEIVNQVICLGNNVFIGGRVYASQEAFGPGEIATIGAHDETHDLPSGLYGDDEIFMMKFCGNYVEILEGDTIEACAGTPLAVTGEAGWETYDWTGPETSNLETWSPATTGQYILTANDFYSCESEDTIEVIINPLPTPTLLSSNGTEICGTGASTDLSTATAFAGYVWSDASTNPTLTVNSSGTYQVTVTDAEGCEGSTDIVITEATGITVDLGPDVIAQPGDQVTFSVPTGYSNYVWTPSTDFSCQNCAMSDLSVNGPTEVIVVVTDANGCTGTDTAQVIVSTFTIPSGFSPNGDGINDSFVIPGIETSNAELTVWNRWGGKVFESSNYQNNWDASCQGSGCLGSGIVPEGTYFYAFIIGDEKYEGYLTVKK